MTIPIQLPQIGTTGIAPRQPTVFELAAPILEAIAQQKVAQAQLQSVRALTEQRRQEAAKLAQDTQDQADAAKAFYNHVSGAATRVKPEKPAADGTPSPQGIDNTTGMLMPLPQFERSLSPQAHKLYMDMISGHNATIQQSLTGAETQVRSQHEGALTDLTRLQADAATRAATDEANTQKILGTANLATESGQRDAIRKVLQIVGPEVAAKLANTLNVGTGRYGHLVTGGQIYITDSKMGTVKFDRFVPEDPKIAALRAQALQRGAENIVDLLDVQTALIRAKGKDVAADPGVSAALQHANFFGLSAAPLAQALRSDPQQVTQMLKTRFAHNYVGMLPSSRSAGNLLANLVESYWPPAGTSTAGLDQAQRDRVKLRGQLVAIRDGRSFDMSKLPGFVQAALAAAQEAKEAPGGLGGNATQAQPDPDQWAQGVPPP